MTALLEMRDVSARYGRVHVLQHIDLRIDEGRIVTLLGANGAGKTTLLRALCNMMVQLDGEVRLGGHRIDRLSTESIARSGVAHVPDGRGTFAGLTVEENLTLGACTRRDRGRVRDDFARIYGYFPRLFERRSQQAGTLSGGEQQMLAISRALMLRPRLLLLDEPSFGLAPIIVEQIFSILRVINRDEGVAMLLVEQNARVALALADDAYLMETGRVVMSGSADALSTDENVRRSYLGY
ncbi:ABC transporter ATP-binding protein [Bradyrhizobium sp. U87765 SZCCT0131]|uniref:ABC transporter ATP-binding protein n=1 Tax=unclassified Bradyrhizobium TaxID=2631580 RepID=UPI001BA74AED|nr:MULTISPECIES: ABC transporter ATP-binding protein [unclassified Bradyrhizobium]MBR1218816.1 ABC transporter ATP-binding protein [Bradyrhizobium sp. U87765 SZCCT0131]MBR1261467.1 ABC transporter ATP-binding protein [Bradyrhizobium sp. U87765 SZCCT0134]MBR1306680.1 ABC transporter ATP-binding protein [Bradyrhizobium sp. U87765 SZCCT0110]MBR1317249.1 ABC transporter ATP-binding protein [Bradyrhizobium sp. U87765 SZCCT0109]MBR1350951.1 ABC transporter ATP-binding protein [Bradyrhizobium sp. U87